MSNYIHMHTQTRAHIYTYTHTRIYTHREFLQTDGIVTGKNGNPSSHVEFRRLGTMMSDENTRKPVDVVDLTWDLDVFAIDEVCMYVFVYVCICVCVCVYMYMYVCMYIYMKTRANLWMLWI